jgi:hypothetical protein
VNADELELRAMLMAALLTMHPAGHRFITPEVMEELLDAVFAWQELDVPTIKH